MLKGYITNLGKYVEGQLIGKWIEFPIMEDELEEVKEQIGINEFYEEYFFTDWETEWDFEPYKEWGEYPDIEEVNTIAEELESIEYYGDLNWLWAYWEDNGGSLYDAVMNYVDNSRFYGIDTYEIVYEYLNECHGINECILDSIITCMDLEDFISSYMHLDLTDYGYIECF